MRYRAIGLPAGLAINHATGVITGRPRSVGTKLTTVYATDSQSLSGRASFSWAVGGPPRVTHASLSGLGQARPTLTFAISAGRDAPGLRSVAIRLPGGLRFSSTQKLTVTSSGKRIAHAAQIAHSALAVKLAKPATGVQVTIGYASLTASGGLAAHPPRTLRFVLEPIDAAGAVTTLAVEVRS